MNIIYTHNIIIIMYIYIGLLPVTDVMVYTRPHVDMRNNYTIETPDNLIGFVVFVAWTVSDLIMYIHVFHIKARVYKYNKCWVIQCYYILPVV